MGVFSATHLNDRRGVSSSTFQKDQKLETQETIRADSSEKAVHLSYKAYESRPKKDKPMTKSPLVIQHSLLGSKTNWKNIAKVGGSNRSIRDCQRERQRGLINQRRLPKVLRIKDRFRMSDP